MEIQDIQEVLDKFQDIKYSGRKKEVENLVTDPNEFGKLLLGYLIEWKDTTTDLQIKTRQLEIDDIVPNQITQNMEEIVGYLQSLLEILDQVRKVIGPITFEDIQEEIAKEIVQTISSYTTTLETIVSNFPYDVGLTSRTLSNIKTFSYHRTWGSKSLENKINQAAKKELPEADRKYGRKTGKFLRNILDFKYHLWVIIRVFYLILFFAFVQSGFHEEITKYIVFIEYSLSFLLLLWVIRALRKKKISILLTAIIIFGIPLAWLLNIIPTDFFGFYLGKSLVKILLWLIVIYWFPVQFLNIIKNYRVGQVILLLIIWSAILSLWAYGIVTGLLVATLLLVIPIYRLLNGSKAEQRNLSKVLDRRLYLPTSIMLLIVTFIITKENLWLLASVIWIMFTLTASHSYRYFRRTYDLIEELFSDPQGRQKRHYLLFFTLVLSTTFLFPGVLGKLKYEFVSDLYIQTAGLAFGLITILLAVQAIIPGITTWSGENNSTNRLREMRSILRANAGLEGFMQLFFILFIFSLGAWLISTHFLKGFNYLADFSFSTAFEKNADFVYLYQNLNQGNSEPLIILFSTIIFSVYVYIAIYGIAHLYYLFIATNTLSLPIRDSILSSSVEIEQHSIYGIEDTEKADKLVQEILENLKNKKQINGQIINSLVIHVDPEKPNNIQSLIADFEMDFIEKDELLRLIKNAVALQ